MECLFKKQKKLNLLRKIDIRMLIRAHFNNEYESFPSPEKKEEWMPVKRRDIGETIKLYEYSHFMCIYVRMCIKFFYVYFHQRFSDRMSSDTFGWIINWTTVHSQWI